MFNPDPGSREYRSLTAALRHRKPRSKLAPIALLFAAALLIIL